MLTLPSEILQKIMSLGDYTDLLAWRKTHPRLYRLAKQLPGTFSHQYYTRFSGDLVECRRTALGLLDGLFRKFFTTGKESGYLECERHYSKGVLVGSSMERIDYGWWKIKEYYNGKPATITYYHEGRLVRQVRFDEQLRLHGRIIRSSLLGNPYEDIYEHGRRISTRAL